MLFSVKNRLVPTLLPLTLFVAGALLARHVLRLMLAHALHDVGGFSLFALQRRTGRLLTPATTAPERAGKENGGRR